MTNAEQLDGVLYDYLEGLVDEPDVEITDEIRQGVQRHLQETLPSEVLSPFARHPDRERLIRAAIREALTQLGNAPARISSDSLNALYAATVGLGPLEPLLADEEITSITVTGPHTIIYEKDGRQLYATETFRDRSHLLRVIESFAVRAGRTLSHAEPVLDLQYPVTPPLRVHINLFNPEGATFSLRRGRRYPFGLEDFVRLGSASEELVAFLRELITLPVSTLVVGVPNTGKSTWLEALINAVVETGEHLIVACEDTPELSIHHPLALKLNLLSSAGEYSLGHLAWMALRCNSEVLTINEVRRGPEAGALLMAAPSMSAVMTTLHGGTVAAALERFLVLALSSEGDPPSPFGNFQNDHLIRRVIATSFPLVLLTARLSSGRRILQQVCWLDGVTERDEFALTRVFTAHTHVEDGELAVTWERNPDFELPPLVRDRLRERTAGRARVAKQHALAALAQACQRSIREQIWREAAGLIPHLLRQRPELYPEYAPALEQALRQTGEWPVVERQAALRREAITTLIQQAEWETLKQQLAAIAEDPQTRLVLEGMLPQWTAALERGQADTAAAVQTCETAEELAQAGQPEQALELVTSVRPATVAPGVRKRLRRVQLDALVALAEAASDPEEARRLWAQIAQVADGFDEALARRAREVLPGEAHLQDVAERYRQGVTALRSQEWQRGYELLKPLGPYRQAVMLAELARRQFGLPNNEETPVPAEETETEAGGER